MPRARQSLTWQELRHRRRMLLAQKSGGWATSLLLPCAWIVDDRPRHEPRWLRCPQYFPPQKPPALPLSWQTQYRVHANCKAPLGLGIKP